MSSPYRVGVVVQTHWDREWYFTREQFLARLSQVMEQVAAQLESGKLRSFLFDGQVIALEDLVAHAEPALVARVLALARDGRLVLGPWYVMADEFLCSGESLWRNLEIGMAAARAFGNCQAVGYLPDTFGHVAQMPQILQHFKIDSAVLWRGADQEHSEFDWVAPDGSSVGTLFLTQGYYQHPFNVADWRAALKVYLDQITPRARSTELLLTQGGDHLMSSELLAERITAINTEQTRFQFEQSSLTEVVTRTLAATQGTRTQAQGELRRNQQAFVIPDVLSTRRPLKRRVQALEDRLLGELEPLLAQLKISAPERAMDHSWRALIAQFAHDSICGCSVDAVHREMESRLTQLDEKLDTIRYRALVDAGLRSARVHQTLAPGQAAVFGDDAFCTVFNPLPFTRTGWQLLHCFLTGDTAQALDVRNAHGVLLPSQLISSAALREFHSPLDEFPDPVAGTRYEVAVQSRWGGLEAKALQLKACTAPDTSTTSATSAPTLDEPTIANATLRVELDDGALCVSNQSNPSVRTRLQLLTALDAGDSYNYAPPRDPAQRWHSRFTLISARRIGPLQELRLHINAVLPASLNTERSGPSAAEVSCTGELRLRLLDDARHLDVQLHWSNQAQDQRTRLVFSLPGADAAPLTHAASDTAFDWTTRPVVLAQYPTEISRKEMPVAVNPSYSAVAAGPVQIGHAAMQEWEILATEHGQALGMTLLRSVGWMSRRDLVTRGVGAGPDMATPDAQCLGDDVFDFQLLLQDSVPVGEISDQTPPLDLLRQAQLLRRPLQLLRGQAPSAWRSGHTIANPALQVSACRSIEGTLELRVWNPTDQLQSLQINTKGWKPHGANALAGSALDVAPRAIATFRRNL